MKAKIYIYGAPVLRKKASRITNFGDELHQKALSMLDKMHIAQGIGLAAPQVGNSTQLIVIDLGETHDTVTLDGKLLPLSLIQPLFLVNPSFEPLNNVQESREEGCLSLPEVQGSVRRYQSIEVQYQDCYGNAHTLQCQDLLARCVQHECDHLLGILFIDRIAKAERREQTDLLNELKNLGGTFQYDTEE